jgi:hypothetical protein
MKIPDVIRLTWHGLESIEAAKEALQRHGNVELQLPDDFHHTLFVHLHPGSAPVGSEQVDETGGAELLSRIAEINGLTGIANLVAAVTESRAKVRVISPSPKIIVELEPNG